MRIFANCGTFVTRKKTTIVDMDANIQAALAEKYEKAVESTRPMNGQIWLTNDAMNATDPENPVLVPTMADQFNRENSRWKKQGYRIYKHVSPAPAPTEAKKVGKKPAGNDNPPADIIGEA